MKLEHIHSDNRGSIFSVTESPLISPEVSFLHTKAYMARGGCIHRKNVEHLCVIEGVVQYFYRLPEEVITQSILLSPGKTISVPPNTPHYMISYTDSVVIEWGCEIEEKKEKHEEFRSIVLNWNKGKELGN